MKVVQDCRADNNIWHGRHWLLWLLSPHGVIGRGAMAVTWQRTTMVAAVGSIVLQEVRRLNHKKLKMPMSRERSR